MDDIILYGKFVEEYDENLQKILYIIREFGLKLNKEKCEFKKDKLIFFGYVFSVDGVSLDLEKVKAIREFRGL